MVIKQKFEFWPFLRDKVVPSLVTALAIGMFATYIQIVRVIDAYERTRQEVAELRVEVSAIREGYVKRIELTEVLKRVEQQLEIVLLKAQRGGR